MPLLLGRQNGGQLSFHLLTTLLFALFLRNVIAYSNNLVLLHELHGTKTGLQAEGYRWLELEVHPTEHELAGQLEVGHRDCNLLVVMILGHDFYHITLIFGPFREAKHGQSQHMPRVTLFITKETMERGPADP